MQHQHHISTVAVGPTIILKAQKKVILSIFKLIKSNGASTKKSNTDFDSMFRLKYVKKSQT